MSSLKRRSPPPPETCSIDADLLRFDAEAAPASVDIFGCCVARDIFGFHPDVKQYSVRKFIQWNSAISAINLPLQQVCGETLTEEDCVSTNAFWQRIFLTDVNKTVFSELNASRADWLLLDLSDTGFNLVRVTDRESQTQTIITGTNKLWENLPLIREHGKLSRCETTVLPILDMDQYEVLASLKEFVNRMLEIYPPERIVLLEVQWGKDFLADEGFTDFPNWEHWEPVNHFLEMCLATVEQALPDSYVIRMPAGLYCDPNHKWGVGERHYCKEYYDYGLKAFQVITNEKILDKQNHLNTLCQQYANWFHKQRKQYL